MAGYQFGVGTVKHGLFVRFQQGFRLTDDCGLAGDAVVGQHHEQLSLYGIPHATKHILDLRRDQQFVSGISQLKGVAVKLKIPSNMAGTYDSPIGSGRIFPVLAFLMLLFNRFQQPGGLHWLGVSASVVSRIMRTYYGTLPMHHPSFSFSTGLSPVISSPILR